MEKDEKNRTMADLKRCLQNAFGNRPFRPSQLSTLLTKGGLVLWTTSWEEMVAQKELAIVRLEDGREAFRFLENADQNQKG